MTIYRDELAAGYACLTAWSALLDRINVFPVADGDTGANLRISLAPLRSCPQDGEAAALLLSKNATGNSGNIAAAFFGEFCRASNFEELRSRTLAGRDRARQAVADPVEGTMLSLFDALAEGITALEDEADPAPLLAGLRKAVRAGVTQLDHLRRAGVVDAGALGMYIFFHGFFTRGQDTSLDPTKDFAGLLRIDEDYAAETCDELCVDAVVDGNGLETLGPDIGDYGTSVVMLAEGGRMKIHLHTADPQGLRDRLSADGRIVAWHQEEILQQPGPPSRSQAEPRVHLITDGAGSLTRELAREVGITLLDSYVVYDSVSRPESLCDPGEVYARMRAGEKVTTAQASTFERHQLYHSACSQHECSIYLCVGSAFTGNYQAASAWKQSHELGRRLVVIDSGAASGRLGLTALLAARCCLLGSEADKMLAFVSGILPCCLEYVFIDELKYLVAGGRVSRAGGFFGDLLQMKPIISPTREGVRREGVVRSRRGQVEFALQKLDDFTCRFPAAIIMLQYSDNEAWLRDTFYPLVKERAPGVETIVVPLSLTSGVHMGPGTWSMALAPSAPPAGQRCEKL